MAGDPLRKVTPGNPSQPISSRTWNAFIDATKHPQPAILTGPPGASGPAVGRGVTIRVKNDTGDALEQLSILELSGVEILPEDNAASFRAEPVATGIEPTGDDVPFCILEEALYVDKIGRGRIAGAYACKLLVNETSHAAARPISGDYEKLETATSGPCKIIYKAAAGSSGIVDALVMLADPVVAASADPDVIIPLASNSNGFTGGITTKIEGSRFRFYIPAFHGVTEYTIDDFTDWKAAAVQKRHKLYWDSTNKTLYGMDDPGSISVTTRDIAASMTEVSDPFDGATEGLYWRAFQYNYYQIDTLGDPFLSYEGATENFSITAVTPANKEITVSGDASEWTGAFRVVDSTDLDGEYTIDTVTYSPSTSTSLITVNETISGSTADGSVQKAGGYLLDSTDVDVYHDNPNAGACVQSSAFLGGSYDRILDSCRHYKYHVQR